MENSGFDVVNSGFEPSKSGFEPVWERLVRENAVKWQDYVVKRTIHDENGCWNFVNRARNRPDGQVIVCLYLGQRKNTTVDIRKLSYVAFVDFAHGLSVRHVPVRSTTCANPQHLRCGLTSAMHREVTSLVIADVKRLRELPQREIAKRCRLGSNIVSDILRGRHPLQKLCP